MNMKKLIGITLLFVLNSVTMIGIFVPQTFANPDTNRGWIHLTVYGESEGNSYKISLVTVWIDSKIFRVIDTRSFENDSLVITKNSNNAVRPHPLSGFSYPSGIYNISITEPGHAPSEIQTIQVKANEKTDVVFTLKKIHTAGAIHGRVTGTITDVGAYELPGIEPYLKQGIIPTLSNDPGFDVVPENERFPLSYTKISIVSDYSGVEVATTFTDKNGNYSIPSIEVGVYQVMAKKGLQGLGGRAPVESGKEVELNFLFLIQKETIEIDNAINAGKVGGEITIQKETDQISHDVLIYNGVNITTEDIMQGKVTVVVGGDENSSGKTIAFNIDQNVLDINGEITINYDGENIKMADNIEDVLNPNDDGAHPEYFIIAVKGGLQVLVSIPHFSEHSITISSVVELLGGIFAVILYVSVFLLLGVFYISSFFLVRGRKRK